MEGFTKLSVFLFLLIAKGHALTDSLEELEDTPLRSFILEQNKDTRELIKAEMEIIFDALKESFNQKFTSIRSDMEKADENLSRSLKEELATIELNMESKFRNMSDLFDRGMTSRDLKMEDSLNILSESFNGKLEMSERNILSYLQNQIETVRINCTAFAQVHDSISTEKMNQFPNASSTTETPENSFGLNHQNESVISTTQTSIDLEDTPTLVELEELSGDSGTIEFHGGANSHLQNKIWVLRAEETTYIENGIFFMEENNLGGNGFLSLCYFQENGGRILSMWNGSQTDWRKETDANYHLILLTLSVKPSVTPSHLPAFKLRFQVIWETSVFVHSGEVMAKNGVNLVSYPSQNTQNYPPKGAFHAVIAPQCGRPFKFTLKYLNVPGTPPTCDDTWFNVYLFEESPSGGDYKQVAKSSYRECGRMGNVSWILGSSNLAIVQFYSRSTNLGTGIRLEVDTYSLFS